MSISEPPKDQNGVVTPHDHPEIEDDDWVIRRIDPVQYVTDDVKAPGGKRLSSMVFRISSESPYGMSIDIQKLIEQDGLDPRDFIKSPQFLGAIRLQASAFRIEGLQVGYEPLPNNPYHGEVWGKFTNGKEKKLFRASEWLIELANVAIWVDH